MRKIANETKIGQLVIDLQIKTEALERGFETAKKKIQELEQQNEQLKSSNSSVDASFIAMSAGIIGSLHGVINIIKECTEEYNTHIQAMSSLSDVADYTGNNLSSMSNLMDKYSKYMTKSDLAATIKNFSLMNMTMEQQDQIIGDLINSAIKNRNANYDVSTAVKVASDGYKQGLSTLSDSAGVTENLSVMQKKYAESIGKTVGQLTEEEQNQAYINRTMEAAAPFVGAMSEYLDTLAGKQGEYSQSLRETKIAYAEAMEPILVGFTEFKTMMLSGLSELISNNKEATIGTTAFIFTLLTGTAAVIAGAKAKEMYAKSTLKATLAEKGFAATMKLASPMIIVTAISTAIGVFSAYKAKIDELNEATQSLNETNQRYSDIEAGKLEYTDMNISKMQTQLENLKRQKELFDEIANVEPPKVENSNNPIDKMKNMLGAGTGFVIDIDVPIDELNQLQTELGNTKDDIDGVNKKIKITEEYLKKATSATTIKNAMDVDAMKTQQKEAAQLKANVNQMQDYLNTVKQGNKSTSDYQNAVKQLAKTYPEAASAEGIIIDQAQAFIDAEKSKADQAWNASQATIQGNIDAINTFIGLAEAAKNDEVAQAELAQAIGLEYSAIIPTLTTILGILNLIGGYSAEQVPNVTPTSVSAPKVSSGGGSSSYSNKKLDNYKKEIEHKKAMDQISLQQEISMYEYALRVYAKTADERMELREKIYSLNKELAQKEKEILDQQTEDYEAYIQQQINSRGAEYNINDRNRDYNKIIQMHKNYLNQIMYDERLSLDERKQIYREELQTIRDYEQQKRDLRVEQIDNTVSNLTNAITKQLEEMQEKDKQLLDENLKVVEEWKNARIKAINEEYDAKIEAINKELEALNKAEQQKTRDEEDTEYEKKKKRLEDLIAFEHDATTRANYQKELDKLVAEYQKTLDKRALEDKKEALNEQKELLQEEQDNKVQAVEDEAKKQTELYENQLTELEKYYDEQIEMAQKTAENMLLNVSQNQNQILELLKNYGDAYEITGQTLGEKLAQGINEGIASKIENIIARLQNTIDANIEAQIARMTSSAYKYEAGANKPTGITNNIVQNNYIEQNPEMPSETYRKLHNVSEDLAAQLRTEMG